MINNFHANMLIAIFTLLAAACLCNLNGTANVSSLSFGGCVKDETVLSLHPGKVGHFNAGNIYFL